MTADAAAVAEETAWRLLEFTLEMQRVMDQKAVAILASAALVVTGMVVLIGDSATLSAVVVVALSCVVATCGSIACAAVTLWPRKRCKDGLSSLLYYRDIARYESEEAYRDKFALLGPKVPNAVLEQVWQIARIVDVKSRWSSAAVATFLVALLLGVVAAGIQVAAQLAS